MSLRIIGNFLRNDVKCGNKLFTVSTMMFSTSSRRGTKMLENVPNFYIDKSILRKYQKLEYDSNKVQATYVWIDGTGEQVRSKDRILTKIPKSLNDIPEWSYDGSSTYQAVGENSDTTLVPRAIYKNPFKQNQYDIIVMCDTYKPDGTPQGTNHRALMAKNMDSVMKEEPWFGIEQEYTLLDFNGRPFGWPECGYPGPQGPYYCGVGANNVYARDLIEAHAYACLYAGIEFGGTNAEVMPSQWEYQVGPSLGMKCADDLWVSRFILWRLAEEYGLVVTFHPKPVQGQWNGAGAHTNFSTEPMRREGGLDVIKAAIEKLAKKQEKHIMAYDPKQGKENEFK